MQQPKVIFLDAVGTLFGVRGSVGEVYSTFASQFNVRVSPELLNEAFFRAFANTAPPSFPGASPDEIPQLEFEWWWTVAAHTFQEVGVIDQFDDFTEFFDELYNYFATAQPWFVYPDVWPALVAWHRAGIELGVLSNFDSRLYFVLKALELDQFFTSVTVSTQAGVAKPDPEIFTVALAKHQCTPQQAWHIGDSVKEDYQGAQAAGVRAILLERLTEGAVG